MASDTITAIPMHIMCNNNHWPHGIASSWHGFHNWVQLFPFVVGALSDTLAPTVTLCFTCKHDLWINVLLNIKRGHLACNQIDQPLHSWRLSISFPNYNEGGDSIPTFWYNKSMIRTREKDGGGEGCLETTGPVLILKYHTWQSEIIISVQTAQMEQFEILQDKDKTLRDSWDVWVLYCLKRDHFPPF